jgi:hypothetical protein
MGKRRAKREDPSPSQKCTNPNGVKRGKGTNYVPQPPLIARSILEKDKEEKIESITSLKKPSPAMMTQFKIKTTFILCKTIDTLCL